MRRRLARILVDLTRHRSGRLFVALRRVLYRWMGTRLGSDVRIFPGVYIEYPERLEIGSNVSIQHGCFLSCYAGVTIGDDVSIGHGTSIVTSTHPLDGDGPIRSRPLEGAPVEIGNDVWVGMKASILHGVTIGEGVVLGAHALAREDIPPGGIAVGLPARVVGWRDGEASSSAN